MVFVSRAIIVNCDLVSILNFELVVCSAYPKQQGQAVPSQKLLLSNAVFAAVLHYSQSENSVETLFADKENEPAIIDNLCTVWPTYYQN